MYKRRGALVRRQRVNARNTYLTYFGFLLVIIVIVGYAARDVIFRPWTARSWVATASLDGKLYAFGGRNEKNELMQDALVVDPAADTLKRIAHQPMDLFGSSAAVVDGAIFVAGGTNNKSVSDIIYRFDTRAKRLVVVGHLPGPRAFGGLVAVGGGLYYLGGWDGNQTSNDIIKIDPRTGTASVEAHLPLRLEQFATAPLDGTVLLIGGMNGEGNFVSTIYAIRPQTGTVEATGNLDVAAARMTAAVYQGSVYATGGWNGKEPRELYRIQRSGSSIQALGIITIDYPILDASLTSSSRGLYLIGGQERRFHRQVQILQIEPRAGNVSSLILKSYAWW